MFKNILFALFIFCVANGCGEQVSNETGSNMNAVKMKDSTMAMPADTIEHSQENDKGPDNTLSPGSDTLVMEKHIAGIKDHPEISFSVSSGKLIHATLTGQSDSSNIRIGQIEMPDGTFDGPFGKQLQYAIKSPGQYKLIISENMMAEGAWAGDFTVKVWVTE